MRKRIKQFTEQIRKSDETTKRTWSLFFSAVATLAILGLWGAYASLFSGGAKSAVVQLAVNSEAKNQSASQEQVANINKTFGNLIGDIKGATGARRNLRIDLRDRNFIDDDLEPIPPTPLP